MVILSEPNTLGRRIKIECNERRKTNGFGVVLGVSDGAFLYAQPADSSCFSSNCSRRPMWTWPF